MSAWLWDPAMTRAARALAFPARLNRLSRMAMIRRTMAATRAQKPAPPGELAAGGE